MLYRSVDAVSVTHLMSLVAQEVYLYVSVKGKCVQSSAQTERAAQMQGWMNIQWRRPEEDLQGDVSRKVPLHTTPPLPMKLRTRAFHHTFCTQRYNGFRKWGCFLRTVKCYYFQFAGLMLRVDHTHCGEEQNYLQHTAEIQSLWEAHSHPWWVVSFMNDLSLSDCV